MFAFRRLFLAALFALTIVPVAPFATGDARAAGSSGKSDAKTCKRGETYSRRAKKCVRDDSASLTSEDRYEAGRLLALTGDFEGAIAALERADRTDPRVLNYLGFAARNLGRVEEGMAHYRAALAIDPDFTLARSYMGQAMLQAGDRDGALEQLRLIRAVTGPVSLEYIELRDALRDAGSVY